MAYTPPPSTQVTQLATSDYDSLLAWIRMQEGIVADLEAEIERLKAPSTRGRTLVISKTVLQDLAGVTVENGHTEPDDAQYERVRVALKQAAEMGFNAARWFLNPSEVQEHLSPASPTNLPNYALSLGIAYIADTVDSVVWQAFKIEDDITKSGTQKSIASAALKSYLLGLATLGARAFVVNDANTYRTPKFPANTLERIVARIRAICPDMPLIASLTGNATISDYKPLFDHVEAQTFGKLSELPGFLAKPFDVYCFDGRKGVSEAYLKGAKTLILERNPAAMFWYPALTTDWQAESMRGEVQVIREIVQAWHKM